MNKHENEWGDTKFHIAIQNDNIGMVKSILLSDPSIINICDAINNMGIHIACQYHSKKCMQYFIDNQIFSFNARGYKNRSPMHIAIVSKFEFGIELLLSETQTKMINESEYWCHFALEKNISTSCFEKLLIYHKQIHCDKINICDNNGNTMLHISGQENLSQHMKLILKNNPETNIRNQKGLCPIHISSYNCFSEGLKILIDHDSNNNNNSNHSNNSNNTTQVDINSNCDGINPLQIAIIRNDRKSFDYLVNSSRIQVDTFSTCMGTALHLVISPSLWNNKKNQITKSDQMFFACRLIQAKANVNILQSCGRSAIVSASITKNIDLVQLLLESGAKIPEMTNLYGNMVTDAVCLVTERHSLNNEIYNELQSQNQIWIPNNHLISDLWNIVASFIYKN